MLKKIETTLNKARLHTLTCLLIVVKNSASGHRNETKEKKSY